ATAAASTAAASTAAASSTTAVAAADPAGGLWDPSAGLWEDRPGKRILRRGERRDAKDGHEHQHLRSGAAAMDVAGSIFQAAVDCLNIIDGLTAAGCQPRERGARQDDDSGDRQDEQEDDRSIAREADSDLVHAHAGERHRGQKESSPPLALR